MAYVGLSTSIMWIPGEQAWRFYTVPSKDELGGETWEGDSWMTGGSSAWVTGSYDPKLNLVS